jgi:hypothetical protein
MSIKSFPSSEIPSVSNNSGKVLTNNGSEAYWGSTGSMTLLGTANYAGNLVSFTNIDQSYRDLKVVGVNLRVSTSEIVQVRVNDITGSGFYPHAYDTSGGTTQTNGAGSQGGSFAWISSSGNAVFNLDIYNYADTNRNTKPWRSLSNFSTASSGNLRGFGSFNSTSSTYDGLANITKLSFYVSNAWTNGTFYLYGVK